ncbi:MAG: hypothetical protein Q8O43_03675 [Dehalococcoidia bacterium]|nr:hypothetical protein [Dehalococcoidia bacterium]
MSYQPRIVVRGKLRLVSRERESVWIPARSLPRTSCGGGNDKEGQGFSHFVVPV